MRTLLLQNFGPYDSPSRLNPAFVNHFKVCAKQRPAKLPEFAVLAEKLGISTKTRLEMFKGFDKESLNGEEDEEDEDGEDSRPGYKPGNIFCVTCNKYNPWEIDLGSSKKKWKNQYYDRYCTVCGEIVSTVDQQRAKAAEKRKMEKRREPTRSSVNAYLKANMKIKGQKA